MEPLSFLKSILNYFKDWFSWVLRKCGYKIIRLDEYKEEEVVVDFDYTAKSSKCIEESKHGAIFYWSEKYNPGYKRYFEIDGNIRRVFEHNGQYLWIKK